MSPAYDFHGPACRYERLRSTGPQRVVATAGPRLLETAPCPSVRLQETQLSTRAIELRMRWLGPEDRWPNDGADPFWAVPDELVGT